MRLSLPSHVRWSRSTTAVALVLIGSLAFVGLAVGASPYVLVTLLVLGSALVAGRGARVDRVEKLTRAVATVDETIAALPTPDISVVLSTIALQAQMLTGARYVALGIGTDPEKPFDPWISIGMPPGVGRALGRHPRPIGTLGQVACGGEVLRMPDIGRHPAFRGLPAGHPTMSSFLGVPIRYRGRPAGNLYLADKRGAAEFSDLDERTVTTLAARAAVAIETARLYVGEAQRHLWLRNTIDQMPEGVLLLDREGRSVAINRALHAFLREHAPDLASFDTSKAFDVRYPDGQRVPLENLPSQRALRNGEVTMGRELVVCLSDERMVPILANAAPVRDANGEISGATLIIQDITGLKEIERMREEWTSIVAHDLRQPVSVIALAAEGVSMSLPAGVPERTRQGLVRIRGAAQRLNRMIDDLLDASLLESNRLNVDCRAIDLGALIHTVAEDLGPTFDGHELQVEVEGGPLVGWLDADRTRQVLQNLISNAAKHGRPAAAIRIAAVGREGEVEVTVTNDGPSIPPEALPGLFSRFVRTPKTRAERVAGLGLGLYISKGLIEAQGGRIWVDSRPGQQTTFHFTVRKEPPREQALPADSHAL